MIARQRSLIVLTWVALAALALSSTPAAGASISPQPLAEITIAANGGHPTNSAAGQVTPDSVTIEVPIAAGSDDAGINAAWDWCTYGANHNEIYFGQCADGADITSGFRFNPVAIPRGAHIVEAHIRFTVDGPYTGAMTVRFRGEASGNAAPFDDDSRLDNRPLIPDVMADWQITPSDPWTLGETRNSPALTAIVQAIVDRSDWSSGNSLAIITQNVGTATGNWRHRRVIGYERPVWYPGTEYAARLVVTYGEQPPSPSPAPDWSAFGGQESAWLGYSVGTAGDVNGDGYTDVIVGAYLYDGVQTDAGRVFVYHGSASGLGATPAWTADGDQAGSGFGFSVATAGDVNGDGYSDIIIGACNCDNGRPGDGRAFVYLGSSSGLANAPIWTAQGSQAGARLGASVATAGDVNGDGYADIVVGAHEQDVGPGHAYLYLGGASGPSAAHAWTATSGQNGSRYGLVVASAGDVNGDGYADVAVGADRYGDGQIWEGGVYVYLGSATGLSAVASWIAQGNVAYGLFGYSVGSAGDVNGDGYADLIVGVPDIPHPSYEGQAQVYLGSASGLAAAPTWVVNGDQVYGEVGVRVATAGDVDGDGYADIIVAAHRYDNGETDEGRISIYRGSASGPLTASPWIAESNQAYAYLGWGLGTAGDVNGDGYADVIAGAYRYDSGQTDEGAAFVYHGGSDGLSATADWTAEGNQEGATVGSWVSTAGDVNGDGFEDTLVGAPGYDSGETDEGKAFLYYGSATGLGNTPVWTAESNQAGAAFGFVGGAGDVNGDGYDDVIVGALGFDGSQIDGGRAFVYYGSAAGLSTSANWTAEGTQPAAHFGSVSAAGDVNGDGYGDIIVGALGDEHVQTADSAAYGYYGSPSGLSPTPNWIVVEDRRDTRFAWSVSTAGDVNGDGYGDVLVGEHLHTSTIDRQGKARLFYGGPEGLSTTPGWTALGETWVAGFSYVVATAGDVNCDGYSDVVVGSHGYTGVLGWAQGAVYVYHGSAAGLHAAADWIVVGDQADSYFGVAAKTAGDVNGDGCADLVVGTHRYSNGQYREGRASLYLGSRAGLNSSAAWQVEGDQILASYGVAVSSAGDVNSDGYADLIVSAPSFDAGQNDEGVVFVYYGNQGGLSLRPQQRCSDNNAPIAHLGKSDQPDRFRLALLGRIPFGRGKVKLEWEVKPRGALFDGAALQRSANWIDTGTAGAQLDEMIAGLQQDTLYHWRVRLLYHPATTPFQQYSRWITTPWNGWNEARLRTAGPPTAVTLATFTSAPKGGNPPRVWLVEAMLALAMATSGALMKRRDRTVHG